MGTKYNNSKLHSEHTILWGCNHDTSSRSKFRGKLTSTLGTAWPSYSGAPSRGVGSFGFIWQVREWAVRLSHTGLDWAPEIESILKRSNVSYCSIWGIDAPISARSGLYFHSVLSIRPWDTLCHLLHLETLYVIYHIVSRGMSSITPWVTMSSITPWDTVFHPFHRWILYVIYHTVGHCMPPIMLWGTVRQISHCGALHGVEDHTVWSLSKKFNDCFELWPAGAPRIIHIIIKIGMDVRPGHHDYCIKGNNIVTYCWWLAAYPMDGFVLITVN